MQFEDATTGKHTSIAHDILHPFLTEDMFSR